MNEKQAVEHRRDLDYIKWYGECANWKDWWTRQWIRMNDEAGTRPIRLPCRSTICQM